jgi:hypothetical protein
MPQPWWMTDTYDRGDPVPAELLPFAGPKGIALVRAWKDGKTDPGWGLWRQDEGAESSGFMWKYLHSAFAHVPIVHGYQQRRWNFAFVMRSMRLVCIDIDGKNGGLVHAGKLGMLPLTLAETSKSGDGYHLWYATTEDDWDPVKGYAQFADRIALEQGVDLRATGCVYHYPQQRWNGREIVELPAHLKTRLTNHTQMAEARTSTIVKTIEAQDLEEIAIMQDALMDDLKKPVPAGRRNTTLFAIGNQMKMAQVPGWEKQVYDRAIQLGLDDEEASKLVLNVRKYGDV